MLDLSTLESCSELTSEHAKQAASSSTEIRALLKRVGEIARPGEGCPKILMAIARLVGQDWVEGELRVELVGDDEATSLIVLADFGVGIRERMFPAVRMVGVPLDEFHRALELAPQLVLPLRITDDPSGKIVLTPLLTSDEKIHSSGTLAFELEPDSLAEGERITQPPPSNELQVLDEATPDGENVHEATTAPPAPPSSPSGERQVYPPRMGSGPVPTENNPDGLPRGEREEPSWPNDVHERPTVRRMPAIDDAQIAAANRRDPRREED